MLEKNKHIRPQVYKGQSGKAGAAVAVNSNETEFLLAGIDGHNKYGMKTIISKMKVTIGGLQALVCRSDALLGDLEH